MSTLMLQDVVLCLWVPAEPEDGRPHTTQKYLQCLSR